LSTTIKMKKRNLRILRKRQSKKKSQKNARIIARNVFVLQQLLLASFI